MQDRIRQIEEISCNARPDHTLGSRGEELSLSTASPLLPQLPTSLSDSTPDAQRISLFALAKLAQCGDGLLVGRGADLKALLATEPRRLEHAKASFRLPTALSIDTDLTTAGVTTVHPLLCSENTSARVLVARSALFRFLLW